MFVQKQPSRKAPGIFSYIELFSSKFWTYAIFFSMPFLIGFFSMIFQAFYYGTWSLIRMLRYFIQIYGIFMCTSLIGVLITLAYSKKAPILKAPPKGWAFQLNAIFNTIIGGSFLFGQLLVIIFKNITFQEVFFMLGIIISYILAFVIYYSFTTAGKYGNFILALTQPMIAISLYSIYTAQISLLFFIRAILFFSTCALIFTIPYARGIFHVSNIYREATGLGGYPFIRAFVLSMMTEGNDDKIEQIFDKVGIDSSVKIQYLAIRNEKDQKIKGMFVVPHIHFGPFKTCGSSDLPELIYKALEDIPGTTVYHTTTDHTQNLTKQEYVNKVVKRIREDVLRFKKNHNINWTKEIIDFSRKISNNSKVIGTIVQNVPIIFLTRHPLPSDDIQAEIGNKIRKNAQSNEKNFKEIMIIDAHNSIIDDEHLVVKDSIEGRELIDVSNKFLKSKLKARDQILQLQYGVANDRLKEFSEKQGIGYGGIVVHLFKNSITNQKTALIHFDANNAYVDIRSYILNALQNRGIERGEITTSDSHTVARQLSSRGYSPIGDKIKLNYIIEKLNILLQKAEADLEPVEFLYSDSIVKNVKIWGNPRYFDAIIATLQECLRVSQRLLTLSLIAPTFFSLILLLFYYNIQITGVF